MKPHFRLTGRVGELAGWSERDVWPPRSARDEWWDDRRFRLASQRLHDQQRDRIGQIVRWLFVNGGMSVVFLGGLLACGVIAAFLQIR